MRRGCVPIGVAFGLLIGACFIKPDPPDETVVTPDDAAADAPSDAPSDATGRDSGSGPDADSDGSGTLSCTSYDFGAGSGGCGAWGVLELGSASTGGGVLTLTVPSSTAATAARCESTARPVARFTLQIASLDELDGHTVHIYTQTNGNERTGIEIYRSSTDSAVIRCKNNTTTTISSWLGSQWIRIEQVSPNVVQMRVSSSGTSWVDLGNPCNVSLGSAEVGIEVSRAGAGGIENATFDSLEICQ